ncbi:hypothetical protein CVS40_11951 [Lucilia cuprina]|nr:hypothetical protein CVS40_11951 [Lucilia cuprina]
MANLGRSLDMVMGNYVQIINKQTTKLNPPRLGWRSGGSNSILLAQSRNNKSTGKACFRGVFWANGAARRLKTLLHATKLRCLTTQLKRAVCGIITTLLEIPLHSSLPLRVFFPIIPGHSLRKTFIKKITFKILCDKGFLGLDDLAGGCILRLSLRGKFLSASLHSILSCSTDETGIGYTILATLSLTFRFKILIMSYSGNSLCAATFGIDDVFGIIIAETITSGCLIATKISIKW